MGGDLSSPASEEGEVWHWTQGLATSSVSLEAAAVRQCIFSNLGLSWGLCRTRQHVQKHFPKDIGCGWAV